MTDTLIRLLRQGPATAEPPPIDCAVDRAMRSGAADVAYAEIDSPLGNLLLAGTPRGLVTVAFAPNGPDAVLDRLAQRLSPRILRAPARLDGARREIDDYLTGRRRAFDLDLDLSLMTPFQATVLRHTAAIPYGHTATYADIAALSNNPRGARAAGNALGANPLPIVIPCHRVLPRGGGPGGYAGGTPAKEILLRLEAASAGDL
jgi:methylated-DNA-[protein]-cysteine S-methyltransferase